MNEKQQTELINLARQLNPTDTTAGIRMSTEEKRQLQEFAKSMGLSFSQLILGACRFVMKG